MPAKKIFPKRLAPKPSAAGADGRIVVENINVPGYTTRVDAAMYAAMRRVLLAVLPAKAPGLTQTEMRAAVLPHLPPDLFPGGAKAGWWSKCVQLDLEAKHIVAREATTPLRWHRLRSRQGARAIPIRRISS